MTWNVPKVDADSETTKKYLPITIPENAGFFDGDKFDQQNPAAALCKKRPLEANNANWMETEKGL